MIMQMSGQLNLRQSLYLDVATKYTGYALFERSPLAKQASHYLLRYGIVKASDPDTEIRCLEMTAQIRSKLIYNHKPGILIQEFPSFHGGEAGAHAATSGATLQLAYLCGRISVCWEYHVAQVMKNYQAHLRPVFNYTYTQWNGQLPKEITCSRFTEHFGITVDNARSIENNFVDAVMLGKWFLEHEMKETVLKGNAGAQREDHKFTPKDCSTLPTSDPESSSVPQDPK